MIAPVQPLNKTQLEILKLFNHPLNNKDLVELKQVLIDFLMHKLVIEADRSIDEKGLSGEEVNNWRFEHNRVKSDGH